MTSNDPTAAAQLALQEKQEKAYTAAPFEPYVESPGGTGPLALPTGPVNPLRIARQRNLSGARMFRLPRRQPGREALCRSNPRRRLPLNFLSRS